MDISPRSVTISSSKRDLCLFVVAGEHSGDALGGRLMAELNDMARGRIRYLGVGGDHMQAHGLASQFPLSDVAVMGLGQIIPRLPRLMRRVYRTVDAAVAAEPDALIIIDSPEFTHPIAKRFRRKQPRTPIIDYVSPSVWAWRPGRAKRMRGYVDHVLALLPFEPEAHRSLGGPPCTYVGHPLIQRLDDITRADAAGMRARLGLVDGEPLLVVLPGSRRSEVTRMLRPFGEALSALRQRGVHPKVVVPVVESVGALVEAGVANWPLTPTLVTGEADKFAAFKAADAALAASGTVTLELALAGTPMVVGYHVDRATAIMLRALASAQSIVLANLVLGRNAFPEFVQDACDGPHLADALLPLLFDTPERAAQRAALAEIPDRLRLDGARPSEAAARIVLELAERGRA